MRFLLLSALCMGLLSASAQTPLTEDPPGGGNMFMIGGGIGAPSGIALILGYDFGPIALRASGGGWEKGWFGGQGDLSVHFNRSRTFTHGISLLAGRYGANPVDDRGERELKMQDFVGVAYDLYLGGFILQAGFAFGKGDYPTHDALFQFGYLFEIR